MVGQAERDQKMITDKDAKKFYDSAAWKQKRAAILKRDHYECQDCVARLKKAAESGEPLIHKWERKMNRATQVHHIQELMDHPELALSDDNLISLCPMDHNLRHGRNPFNLVPKKRKKKISEERW